MKTILPRKYTLEDLVKTDPIGSLYAEIQEAQDAYKKSHLGSDALNVELLKRMQELMKEKPELREEWTKHDINTLKGRRALVSLFNVSEDELLRIKRFRDGLRRAQNSVVTGMTLIRSWRSLKQRAGIKDVGEKNFPKIFERPMLVLYSADWCPPCRVIRPTFARLVHFFDKAEVRYCHEDEWRRSNGVAFIPQFVAYFPSGAKVSSHVGSTTKDMWDTMNALIALGKGWGGTGELVCDEGSCRIITPQKK